VLVAGGLVVPLLPPLAGGCSSSYGEATNDANDASTASDGAIDVSNGNDVIAPGADGGSVGEVGDAPCDAKEAPPADALYVSDKTGVMPAGDGGAGFGTAENPVKTIAAAIEIARSTSRASVIVVDEGTYKEAIELDTYPQSLTIGGAWVRTGASWARDCDKSRRARTLVQSAKDYGASIKGSPAAVITLSDMTIRSRESTSTKDGEPGSSRYGVMVSNAVVVLSDVTIEATTGDAGGRALAAVTADPPCVASTACTATPSAGKDALLTAPGGPASITAVGFVPGNGQAGAKGGDGTTGQPGGAGAAASSCLLSCGGGAGGCAAATGTVTGGPGKCGCAGRGGVGGGAGSGGGASIGVFAASSDVTIKFSEIIAGNGGAGSPGGAGAAGEAGGSGVVGDPADCWSGAICTLGTCPACGCYCKNSWNQACSGPMPTKTTVLGGAAGGQGAPGGHGADGSGGSGGAAHAYATFGVSHVDISASKRTFGSGGTGAGGAPGGKASESP